MAPRGHYCDTVSGILKGPTERLAWDFYMGGTLSIEVLKDEELHKIYFRCKDKVSFRYMNV